MIDEIDWPADAISATRASAGANAEITEIAAYALSGRIPCQRNSQIWPAKKTVVAVTRRWSGMILVP